MAEKTTHAVRARAAVGAKVQLGSARVLAEGRPGLQTGPTRLIEVIAGAATETTNGPAPFPAEVATP